MRFIDLPKDLKEKVHPIYILKGEDSFIIDSAIKHISSACGDEFSDFNKMVFNNENWSVSKFIEATSMLPMGSEHKFVLIKEASKISEADKKNLIKALENLPETTCVTIIFNDSWNFLKTGIIVDCGKADYSLISKFIISELRKKDKKISPDAIRTLIEFCSYDMTKISTELKKVSSYSEESVIEKQDIIDLVTADKEYQIFELTENLGKKRGGKSLQILSNFLQKKEPITILFSLISNHFRRLAHVSISGMSERELAPLLGVKEYAIVKAKEHARYFSKVQLNNILRLLEETDIMIKSGKMSAENSIFYLVFKILYC